MKIDISLNPTFDHIETIRKLMCKGEFHGNNDVVYTAFTRKNLFVLLQDDQPMGFLAFTIGDVYAHIVLMEIKKGFTGRGFGRKLEVCFSDYCLKQNARFITLLCTPIASKGFWIKIGYGVDELTLENNGLYMIKNL
jgi:hypothetical protein